MKKPQANSVPVLARATWVMLGGAFVTLLGELLTRVLVTKFLSPESYGLLYLGINTLLLLAFLSTLNLPGALVRYASLNIATKQWGRVHAVLSFILQACAASSMAVALAIFFFSDFIASSFFGKPALSPFLQVFAVALPFLALTNVSLSAFRSFKLPWLKFWVDDVAFYASRLLFLLPVLALGLGAIGCAVAISASFILTSLASLFFFFRSIPRAAKPSAIASKGLHRELLFFAIPAFFAALSNRFLGQVDVVLLGAMRPAADAGLLDIASSSSRVFSEVFSVPFTFLFLPLAAEAFGRSDFKEIRVLYQTVSKWILLTAYPFFILLFMVGKPALSFFFGDFYSGSFLPLMLLSGGALVTSIFGSAGALNEVSRRTDLNLLNSLVALAANVALSLLLIPSQGVLGAAIAAFCSYLLLSLLRVAEIFLHFKVHPFTLPLVKSFLAITLSGIVALGFAMFFNLQQAFAAPPFFLLSCLVFLRAFRALEKNDFIMLRVVEKKILQGDNFTGNAERLFIPPQV